MAADDFVFAGGEAAPVFEIPLGAGPAVVASTGYTLLESIALILAESVGVRTGAGTSTETFKDPSGTITRFTAAVDSSGNRTPTVVNASP